MSANGQLNRKVKMVREPKSILDMVIPCLKRNKLNRYKIMFKMYRLSKTQLNKLEVSRVPNG